MKTLTQPLIAVTALLVLAVNLHSQSLLPKSPVDQIKAIKAKNAEMIEAQKATLQKLEEMEKQADQIRILAKRA